MQQQDTPTEAFTTISEKLAQLPTTQPQGRIYRVHSSLRNVNDKAYDPKFIAIGPYHHDKDNLKMMEYHKLHYFDTLLQRISEKEETFVKAVGQLGQHARQCYAEDLDLSYSNFIVMLVLDGCFIIELVLKFSNPDLREKDDAIFQMPWIISLLQRDLMLVENQIPFVVLLKLHALIRGPKHYELIDSLNNFFSDIYPISRDKMTLEKSIYEVKHLLDMIYCSGHPSSSGTSEEKTVEKSPHDVKHLLDLRCCIGRPSSSGTSEKMTVEKSLHEVKLLIDLICCSGCVRGIKHLRETSEPPMVKIQSASKLREANVKFEKVESKKFYEIEFKQGTMYLPPLRINGYADDCFTNLIAYEQFLGDDAMFMADYFSFMDCLIDTSTDVEILRRNGIINIPLGDDEMIAKLFNKLGEAVTFSSKSFSYAKTFEEVNKHFNTRTNWWMTILKRQYLNHPWKIISIVAAVVLLLLTIAQTVFSILQVI